MSQTSWDPSSGASWARRPSGPGSRGRKLPRSAGGWCGLFSLRLESGTAPWPPCATAEECLTWSWECSGVEVRWPALFQPQRAGRCSPRTSCKVFTSKSRTSSQLPTNRSETLRAQGSIYKVRDTCAQPHPGPGWGIPLRKGRLKWPPHSRPPVAEHPWNIGKCTWRSRHPAPKLSCSLYKTSGQLHSTAALKWASLPSLHQILQILRSRSAPGLSK